jgi:hypothetical protein
MTNHGYPVTFTDKQWEKIGTVLTIGAGVEVAAVVLPVAFPTVTAFASQHENELTNETEGTVWNSIKATQPLYKGTTIPTSFTIEAGNQEIWVHGNATEHIYEEVVKVMKTPGINPKQYTQLLLSDLQGTLQKITNSGIKYGQLINEGKWELKFGPPRAEGQLPALIHAVFKGWGK